MATRHGFDLLLQGRFPMSDCPALTTTNLTRRFGAEVAVDHVNLRVPRRTVYGFLGPNGAGKSTTLRMLLGLLRPDRGSVFLFGTPLVENRASLLRKVGALVEAPSLYDHLTGRENLIVTGRLRGDVPDTRIDRVLDTVALRDAAHRPVATYSTGMRQRLGLALALLGEPRLLLLDEPTSGLDPAGVQDVRALLRTLPERADITVFLSSHRLDEVERVASHMGVLQDGSLVFQGATQALRARRQSRVTIKTDRPDEAQCVLRHAGLDVGRTDNDLLQVRPGTESTAARCADRLVREGHEVYHVAVEAASLEDTFLALTNDGSPQS